MDIERIIYLSAVTISKSCLNIALVGIFLANNQISVQRTKNYKKLITLNRNAKFPQYEEFSIGENSNGINIRLKQLTYCIC